MSTNILPEGLFATALKKKDEAARKWREQNDLSFTDLRPSSSLTPTTTATPTPSHRPDAETFSSQIQTITQQSATNSRADLFDNLSTLPSQENTNSSIQPPSDVVVEGLTQPQTEAVSSDSTIPTTAATTSVDSSSTSSIASSSLETPRPRPVLGLSLTNLTRGEQLITISFALLLLYLHVSVHSLEDVLNYDYLGTITSTAELGGSQLASTFHAAIIWLQEWYKTFDLVDAGIVLFISVQLTVLFDASCDQTDATLFAYTKEIFRLFQHTTSVMGDAVSEITRSVREGYEAYQRRAPRVVQLVVLLFGISFLIRYALWQIIYALNWFLQSVIYPLRWYALGAVAALSLFFTVHLYLSQKKVKKQSIVKLTQFVKALIDQKPDQQSPIDDLLQEIDDYLVKQELSLSTKKKIKSPSIWRRLFSFNLRKPSVEENEEEQDVKREERHEEEQVALRKRDLNGYSPKSLWSDVQKEVSKDKRIRTVLMFYQGAQRKCWKLVIPPPLPKN